MGMSVPQLKERCRDLGLKVSGRKGELVQRILEKEREEEEAEEEEVEEEEEEEEQEKQADEREGLKKNCLDRFTEALDKDDLEDFPLEEIFNLHIPQPGEIVTGVVTSLADFGAFVEIESGWSGMVHVSEITDSFVDNIEDYLHPGQTVECQVIKSKEDRLDRLSLSMRRINQPPHMQAVLATDTFMKTADGKLLPPLRRRMDMAEEAHATLEIRITAIEAVLSQLGYGEALRAAQHEARDGTKRPAIPSMESMLSSVPKERRVAQVQTKSSERSAIDMVLQDLQGPPPELDDEDLEALDGPSGGEGDGRVQAAGEVLKEVEQMEAERRRDMRSRSRSRTRSKSLDDMFGDSIEESLDL